MYVHYDRQYSVKDWQTVLIKLTSPTFADSSPPVLLVRATDEAFLTGD